VLDINAFKIMQNKNQTRL